MAYKKAVKWIPNDNCVVFVLWLAVSIVWFAHHIDHSFCQLSDAYEMILQNEKRQLCVCVCVMGNYTLNTVLQIARQAKPTHIPRRCSFTYTHIWSLNCILLKTERVSVWILLAFTGDCFDKRMYFIKIYYRTPCTSNLHKRPYIHTHMLAHSHVIKALKNAKKIWENPNKFTVSRGRGWRTNTSNLLRRIFIDPNSLALSLSLSCSSLLFLSALSTGIICRHDFTATDRHGLCERKINSP